MKFTMKSIIIAATFVSFVTFANAEATVTLSGLHNCCKSCANGITKAATSVDGVKAEISGQDVTLTAKSNSDIKKAVTALMDAGFYGTGAEKDSASTKSAAPAKKVKSATVSGVHLCCGKCVTAMSKAVNSVTGVTEANIEDKAKSFTVKGEFDAAELLSAMNKAGFNGKIK